MDFKAKVTDELLRLIRLSSPSLDERKLADYIVKRLEKLGLEVYEDNTGELIGGNTGNIIGVLKAPGKKKIMFNSHMDVVSPCDNVNPQIDGDIIKSDGKTTLGADNKAGIVAILNMLDYIVENKLDHPEIYVVFTVAEELGALGASNIDLKAHGIDYGFILDGFVDPGIVAYGEPELSILQASLEGETGHLFFDVDSGKNAFKAASDAMSKVSVGRIDENTVVNAIYAEGDWTIGAIPGKVVVEYIIASFDKDVIKREIENFKSSFTAVARDQGLGLEIRDLGNVPGFILDKDSIYMRALEKAGVKVGLDFEKIRPVFITDAGNFNKNGVKTCVLGTGVRDAHTVNEWVKLSYVFKNTEYLIELVKNIDRL